MNPLFLSAVNVMLLALESQQAAQLRLYRLGLGGPSALDESALMVREKVEAFGEAAGSLLSGGSFDSLVRDYRTLVQANIRRLQLAD